MTNIDAARSPFYPISAPLRRSRRSAFKRATTRRAVIVSGAGGGASGTSLPVEMAVQSWGDVTDQHGEGYAAAAVYLTDLLGAPVTHYSDTSRSDPQTTVLATQSDGTLPRFVDQGTYFMTTLGRSHLIEAVSGSGGSSVLSGRAWQIGGDPTSDLDIDLTTPESSQVLISRYDDLDRLVSPDPGVYDWGLMAYQVNLGTAPVTSVAARARGESVYPLSSSGRAFGASPEVHGLEITSGVFPSIATVTANGTAVLAAPIVAQDDKGSRFESGMPVTLVGAGLSIPGGTTILSVTGRPGAPTSITLTNTVTGSGPGVLTAQSISEERIGGLITGNGATVDNPDPTGAALQIQSTNAYSHWQYGVNLGASSLQAGGIGFRVASVVAARALSVESAALDEGIEIVNTAVSNALMEFGAGNTGNYGIRFASDFIPGIATIYLPGGSGPHYASIGTDTSFGLQITTNVNMKWAAHGRTPVSIATITGSRSGATVAVLTAALTAMHNKGIITDGTTA